MGKKEFQLREALITRACRRICFSAFATMIYLYLHPLILKNLHQFQFSVFPRLFVFVNHLLHPVEILSHHH